MRRAVFRSPNHESRRADFLAQRSRVSCFGGLQAFTATLWLAAIAVAFSITIGHTQPVSVLSPESA